MGAGVSLYLDLFRFGLALAVFLGHATYRGYTSPGWMWFAGGYAHAAVMGFFVLSGFVIAHVVTHREYTAREYAAARVGRLYSVILPALLLTAVADAWGLSIAPGFYHTERLTLGDQQPLRYLLTLFLIQDFAVLGIPTVGYFGHVDYSPGTVGGIWSLSYEAAYYVAFALVVFLRGPARIVCFILFTLAAGWDIMSLFPLWLAGCAIYRWWDHVRLPTPVALAVFFGSAAMFLSLDGPSRHLWPEWLRQGDYVRGGLCALNILAACHMNALLARLLGWCTGLIRWLGALTFPLYLCHGPVFHLVGAMHDGRPIGTRETYTLLLAGIAVSAVVTWISGPLRNWLRGVVRRWLAPRRPAGGIG